MKLLLLGSGGREHALAWKIAQSPKIEKLYIAPGNAGTSNVGENVAIKADDFTAIREFVVKNNIDMVVVGPEDPLVKGIYDYFKKDEALKNIPVIGPSKAGAVLEGSKEFAKGFMQRHNIPTAGYKKYHCRKSGRRISLSGNIGSSIRTESRRSLRRKRRTDSAHPGRSQERIERNAERNVR